MSQRPGILLLPSVSNFSILLPLSFSEPASGAVFESRVSATDVNPVLVSSTAVLMSVATDDRPVSMLVPTLSRAAPAAVSFTAATSPSDPFAFPPAFFTSTVRRSREAVAVLVARRLRPASSLSSCVWILSFSSPAALLFISALSRFPLFTTVVHISFVPCPCPVLSSLPTISLMFTVSCSSSLLF